MGQGTLEILATFLPGLPRMAEMGYNNARSQGALLLGFRLIRAVYDRLTTCPYSKAFLPASQSPTESKRQVGPPRDKRSTTVVQRQEALADAEAGRFLAGPGGETGVNPQLTAVRKHSLSTRNGHGWGVRTMPLTVSQRWTPAFAGYARGVEKRTEEPRKGRARAGDCDPSARHRQDADLQVRLEASECGYR